MVHSQTASTASADTSGPFLKPGWAPLNIFLMIVGFVLFWPLGLAMLGFNLWGHKLGEFKIIATKDLSPEIKEEETPEVSDSVGKDEAIQTDLFGSAESSPEKSTKDDDNLETGDTIEFDV